MAFRKLKRAKRRILERCSACKKIVLMQSDFNSGTYRIKTSGYYQLGENIEFQPIPADQATRTDLPGIGWFAIITIETEYVILDLNGFTLQATQTFLNQHIFNLFSVVELANSQFPGPQYGTTFGPITTSFTGDTQYVAAKHVLVKNGTCGMSGHFGIHGTNNEYIFLEDVTVRNWEVAGVELHALQWGDLHNVEIIGLEHTIFTRSTAVALTINESFLQLFVSQGVPGAAAMLASLEAFAAANPAIFYTPTKALDSTTYGMLMTSGFSRDFPFPMTPADCVQVAADAGGQPERHIRFKNVKIHDVFNKPEETVSIGTNVPYQSVDFPEGFINVQPAGLFGILRWSDAYDSSGQFAPNAFLQSYAFILTVLFEQQGEALLSQFPPNMPAIDDAILSANHDEFLANVMPIFGGNFNIVLNKGCFAWRIDCGQKLCFDGVQAYNIRNLGDPGMELSQLPDGDQFPQLVQQRYIGNDVWGFEFASAQQYRLMCAEAHDIFSTNGAFVFGFELRGFDQDCCLDQHQAHHLSGTADDTTSIVNPPVSVYGFRIIDCPRPNKIINSKAYDIIAPRESVGFAVESQLQVSVDQRVENCKAWDLVCNSSRDLQNLTYTKSANGFETAGTVHTTFKGCKAKKIAITGEQAATESTPSVAAGFAILVGDTGIFQNQSDTYSEILDSASLSCISGAGVAAGVYLNTSIDAKVKHCTLKNNLADSTFGLGYGLVDYTDISTTTIECVRYKNNSTANESVLKPVVTSGSD